MIVGGVAGVMVYVLGVVLLIYAIYAEFVF
jgi:hypothetical protein